MNTPQIIAACFALAGFAATAVAGVYVGNSATVVLGRAILVMIAAYVLGRILGGVMSHAIRSHIADYKAKRPLPEVDPPASDDDASQEQTPASAGGLSNA